MPNYRTHLVGGVASFGLLMIVLNPYCASIMTAFEWLGFALFGSLFPDVDTKSKGQKYFYRILAIIGIFLLLQRRLMNVVALSTIGFIPLMVKHRGMTHSVWFLMLIAAAITFIAHFHAKGYAPVLFFDMLFFLAGGISHLVLDFGIRRLIFRR